VWPKFGEFRPRNCIEKGQRRPEIIRLATTLSAPSGICQSKVSLTAYSPWNHAVDGDESRWPSADVALSGPGRDGRFKCTRDVHAVVAGRLHTSSAVAAAICLGGKWREESKLGNSDKLNTELNSI
jgi:hypothetical protein